MKNKHLNLISYFGGKWPHLKWLIPLFPKGNYHFVDIMCGSANVALNNDDVINLFKVLRENYDEFSRLLYFTPFSRKELYNIIDDYDSEVNDLEKARRYFVRSQLTYGANGSQNNHKGVGFEYSIQKSNYYRVDNWNRKLDKLPMIVDQLRNFQIESKNALSLFELVNRPNTIVYFDPPYLRETRTSGKRYRHEVDDEFHIQIAEKTKDANCFVAISGYESGLYDDLFGDLFMTKGPETKATVSKREVRECLWTNYNPKEINGVLELGF